MLGVGCATGGRGVVGERVVVVVLEGMGEVVGGVVLEGIHRAVGVERISGRRGRGADGGLGAGRDEDGVVRAGPRGLVVRVGELVVDSGGLLRIVHGISKKASLVGGQQAVWPSSAGRGLCRAESWAEATQEHTDSSALR
jgi:hypothetical protein